MNNEFIEACKEGVLHKVSEILDKGVDIHVQNDLALRFASQRGHLEIVKFLVDRGADIHAINDMAVQWASQNGHLEIVKFLFEKGANIHVNYNSALRRASYFEYLEVVEFLIEKGADISVLSSEIKKKLDICTIWIKKPDNLPSFRKTLECPISKIELNSNISQLGCSVCLNVFEKMSIELWFKTGKSICPMCRTNSKFYLV